MKTDVVQLLETLQEAGLPVEGVAKSAKGFNPPDFPESCLFEGVYRLDVSKRLTAAQEKRARKAVQEFAPDPQLMKDELTLLREELAELRKSIQK